MPRQYVFDNAAVQPAEFPCARCHAAIDQPTLHVHRCARLCQKCWAHKPRQCEKCVPGYHLDSRGQCAGEPTLNRFSLTG